MAKTIEHTNNFTVIRLFLAAAVVLSHSFGFFCAPPSAEPLWRLTHTTTIGTVAVTGFFGISGYLVAGSYLTSGTVTDYLLKRALRIIPAFIGVTILFYVFFVPAITDHFETPSILAALALMPPPDGLNAALWSIPCEARRYLILAALGTAGIFRRTKMVLWLLIGICLIVHIKVTPLTQALFVIPASFPVLLATFLTGAAFRHTPPRFTGPRAALCTTFAVLSLFRPETTSAGLAICGTYVLLYLCLNIRPVTFFNKTDISYGLYLSAWPIAATLKTHIPTITPWNLTAATITLSALFATASWHVIEQPALNFVRAKRRTSFTKKPLTSILK